MNIQNLPDKQEIETVLGLGPQAQAKRWAKRGIWLAVLALAIAGSYLWYQSSQTTANAVTLSLIHISEPTRLLSISYAVFCLKKKK